VQLSPKPIFSLNQTSASLRSSPQTPRSHFPIAGVGVLLAALLAILPSCERQALTGPPDLRLGRDECAACGMLINEDRCSSALLLRREGVAEHACFDDIGCMLDYEFDTKGLEVLDRFLHDHPTRRWVNANAAIILYSDPDKVATPMGSGIIAFADRAAAEDAKTKFGGDLLDFAALVPARRAWMQQRYGKPDKPR
jgi:copper chaperone NosL